MLHPRRLKGTPTNVARYYTVGDYYTKDNDAPSAWGGKIAAELGLNSPVDPDLFKELLAGRVAGQQLGRHRADSGLQHHPGWDFAINAPKSVSIMALVFGDDRVIDAHEGAVTVALDYLEQHALLRHRKDGEIVSETTGRLLYARMTEHVSRALDPHLHTHVPVMNMTNREDGAAMASLETRAMYAVQMAVGQIYRNELAHQLIELGHAVTSDARTGLFEIASVPQALIDLYSTRAREIEDHAQEHGLAGQAARRRSFYETRGPKQALTQDAIEKGWAARAADYRGSLDTAIARARANAVALGPAEPAVAARAALFGIRQAETGEAVNNLGRMVQLALAASVGETRLSDVEPRLQAHEDSRKLLATRHRTGDDEHVRGRTTRKTARLEIALSDHLALGMDDARPVASVEAVEAVLETAGLNPAQEAALRHMAISTDRATGVHGVAGAGKSTLVGALKEAAGAERTLIALAPTSSAANNLGLSAQIEARTVASLLAAGGRGLGREHVLILDEAGQLGNRQALRVLEISRQTGARLILLGDNKQTGAIEQGKAFWLLQKLGMPTAELTESVRQETRAMKAAVTQARLGNYAASLENLDKVTTGGNAENLARSLVGEWTRLKPESRASTNILVLENATRLIVNTRVREALKTEGAIAAEETRLAILAPAGMSDQEKANARFYSGGQMIVFARDNLGAGIARDTEYRVLGTGRAQNGRQVVRLVDEHGRTISWDPRRSPARQVNVFRTEDRELAAGDRIQWRLVSKALGIRNAERGTIERLEGTVATVRWDVGDRRQQIDLSIHKSWDHGYAETVYSSQSKTYDRVYVLAPYNSPLVNGQNYYTAITRARFGVKLWTEDSKRLIDKLERRSGEKSSAIEGLGRLERDAAKGRAERDPDRFGRMRGEQRQARIDRDELAAERRAPEARDPLAALARQIAGNAQQLATGFDRYFEQVLARGRGEEPASLDRRDGGASGGEGAAQRPHGQDR